jgi:hypothetical protein
MSINNEMNTIIKEFLYIIYSENYINKSNNTFIERYVAKHPLLKPQFIVINDELQGFKKVSKKVTSLEEFPIYLEIEGVYDDDSSFLIESIDLYSETEINCQDRLSDIIYLTNLFRNYVTFQRNIDLSNPKEESIIITSKIQDYLIMKFETEMIAGFDQEDQQAIDLEAFIDDFVINVDEFNDALKLHLRFFVEFIKICHDILIKDISLAKLKPQIDSFFKDIT